MDGFRFDSAIGAAKQREAVQKASAIDPIDEFLHDHLGAILSEKVSHRPARDRRGTPVNRLASRNVAVL